MSLKIHSKTAVNPTVDEELFAQAWAVVSPQVNTLINAAWKCDTRGLEGGALFSYKGVAIYHMLIRYMLMMRYQQNRLQAVGALCPPDTLKECFKTECVINNLPCLSKKYGTNYVKAFNDLIEVFEIDLEPCVSTTVYGEWEPCAYEKLSHTKPVGDVTNLYNC